MENPEPMVLLGKVHQKDQKEQLDQTECQECPVRRDHPERQD